jgi:putative DNA primase/helicase
LDLPGLPEKGDVSDFIEQYQDEEVAERLSILLENAEPYEPPRQYTLDDVILNVSDFCALNIPRKETFLSPWLKENSNSLICGPRGAGKTWFAIGLLNGVASGTSFGPWECEKPVPCLFLDGEMPTGDIQERVAALGITGNTESPLYIYSDALASQRGLTRANLTDEDWQTRMKGILLSKGVKLWVIDNIASLSSGIDENTKQEWDPINQWLLELRFAGISTILLHHTNKSGGQRGTSAREDNLDISIMLKYPHDYVPEQGARFIASFTKARIGHKHLNLIGDTEFRLTQDSKGQYIWTWGNVKGEYKRQVLKMLNENITQSMIAETLGITPGYVSQIKKQAFKVGLIGKNGKLTQSGMDFIAEVE